MSGNAPGTATMQAVVHERYGSAEVLELRRVPVPQVPDDRVLVRVRAASLNPVDLYLMKGLPYIARMGGGMCRPRATIRGVDFAGRVETVGAGVDGVKPGDDVFGSCGGALAEYVVARATSIVPKPPSITFEQAAAVPAAGCTALQALRDHGAVQAGATVLINGAAGGVGTFAVQIAKVLGAIVTGVCSTRNEEMVRSLGADEVVDYASDDFARRGRRYDVVVDAVGNRSLRDLRRALTPAGTLVLLGGGGGRVLGPMALALRAGAVGKLVKQRLVFFIAKTDRSDLLSLAELLANGRITPVIDRTYPLSAARDAMEYLQTRRARGKVIVAVD